MLRRPALSQACSLAAASGNRVPSARRHSGASAEFVEERPWRPQIPLLQRRYQPRGDDGRSEAADRLAHSARSAVRDRYRRVGGSTSTPTVSISDDMAEHWPATPSSARGSRRSADAVPTTCAPKPACSPCARSAPVAVSVPHAPIDAGRAYQPEASSGRGLHRHRRGFTQRRLSGGPRPSPISATAEARRRYPGLRHL